jgi:hypothetical protein
VVVYAEGWRGGFQVFPGRSLVSVKVSKTTKTMIMMKMMTTMERRLLKKKKKKKKKKRWWWWRGRLWRWAELLMVMALSRRRRRQ